MANFYVYSGAVGSGTGADWANAYTTLSACLTASAAGDSIYVADDHSETTASNSTLTAPGTVASPTKIFCVLRSGGSVPPVHADLRTTAIVAVTSTATLTNTGFTLCQGLTFRVGSATSAGAFTIRNWALKNGRIEFIGTAAGGNLSIGDSSTSTGQVIFDNMVLKYANVGQTANISLGDFIWRGGSVDASGSIPTNLLNIGAARGGIILVEGVDLSALGSGKNLIAMSSNSGKAIFKDCKLGASVTKCTTIAGQGARAIFSRCDSGATNYTQDAFDYWGAETVETTIVRTGGASDGTTTIAKKLVTTAGAKPITPFRSIPIDFWNDGTTAITCTIQGIWGGGAVPTNADIWLEAEYLSDASAPLGAYASDGKTSDLEAAVNQAAGSGTWGGGTTAFAMAVTFTPAMKGPVRLWVCAGAASSTFYFDPKVIVT